MPPRMQHPTSNRHLYQEALAAVVVINLPVGIGAGIGLEVPAPRNSGGGPDGCQANPAQYPLRVRQWPPLLLATTTHVRRLANTPRPSSYFAKETLT
jgi:hypothetical protein